MTAVSADDRPRMDQNLAQFLNGRKRAGEVDQAPDRLFRITVRGLAWLETHTCPTNDMRPPNEPARPA